MSASPPTTATSRPRLSWGPVLVTVSVATTLLQLYGLYRPAGPPQPAWFPQADKVGHLLGFALPVLFVLLSLAWFPARRQAELPIRRIAMVLAVFAGHAVVSEIIQHRFYPSRAGDPADVLVDWLGVALGAGAFAAVRPALIRRAQPGRVDHW